MDLKEFAGLAGAPLVVALTALIKTAWPELPDRWWPILSVVWGIALNEALAYLLGTRYDVAALVGVVTGLAASGLYSGGRTMVKG